MEQKVSLKVIGIAFHRNGVGGAAFHVVLFEDDGEEGSRKVGIVFDEPGHCAVLDVSRLADGEIRSGRNSWRGDRYEGALRKAIAVWDRSDA
jgi:hypothetical protein